MLNHTMWPPAHCINAKKKKRLDRASLITSVAMLAAVVRQQASIVG